MHVAVNLLTLFPGRVGGAETNVRGLLDEYGRGHGPERVTVLANRFVMRSYSSAGPVTLRHEPRYRPGDSDLTRFLAMNAGRLRPRLDARGFDVVHYPVTVGVPRITGAPRVVTLLDVQHHEMPDLFSRGERWLRRWAYDDTARRADLVITISAHARRGIVERLGIPEERVVVIGLGVDHERFSPDGPRREDLGDYVLYPANLWPHKNHERLLAAWRRADPALTLVLTGQTFGRTIEQDRVVHLGHVALAELPALYRGARAVVFPSLFEGFGLPVLEAMACGTPVAVSDRGPLAELAGDAAVVFDPEDEDAMLGAIAAAMADERLRTAGPARAAAHTWRRAAERHVAAYERAARIAR